MANVASAATSKQSKSSSLELLISKFKTTPLPQDPNNDSESRIESVASSGPTASGSGDHITSEKKSRRKGNPVSFVSTCAQYEIDEDMEVDEYNADLDRVSYNLTPNGDIASPPTTSESLSRPVPEEEIIPEGTIVVNPEAPSAEQEKQAPQVNPEMQGSELASGPELGSKGQAVKDPSYQCTICREPLHVKMFHNIRTHPKIKVTVCKSCYQFYTNGEFTKDEDGLDNQCSWCGEGGNLLICDFCTCAFCKKCIRNNFKRDMIKQIEEAVKWKCLICDPKPLAVHVIRCSDLQKSIEEYKRLASEKPRPKVVATHSLNQAKQIPATQAPPTAALPTAAMSQPRDSSQSSEYDSRIHINIPTAAGLSVNPKAKLTVNLSTIASQYINAQSVVCEDWLLESVIQEHNRFSKELKLIKESLLAAQQQCRHLLVSGDSESVREARNTYTETCRVLGTAMKRKMAESVTNNIKIISKASAKSSAAQRSPAVVSRPSVISKTQLPVQTSAGRGVSRLPLSTPVVSSLVRGGATRSEVKLRPSSHPLLTSAVTGAAAATSRTSREFIDIGELSKENSKKEKSSVEKEVINLCSDDSDDESCRRLAEGASHVSKPSADTSAASAVLSNSDLSTQSELIPKSAVDSRADSVESELIPKSAADPLCSPKSDSTDSELIPKNDAPELALQPADSCDDSDDLVGVTPRRSTRISADQASSAANDESKKKSVSDAAKHPTFDELASTPGPSGLTKRGLKLLLKRQSEEATNTQKKNGAAEEEAAVTNNGVTGSGANTDINKPADDELAPTQDRAVSEPGSLEDELSESADVTRGNPETVSNGETCTQSVESDRETSEDNSHAPMECMDSADVSTALNDSSSAVDCFKNTGSAEKKSAQKQRHTRKTSSRHNEVLDKTPKTAEFVETSSEEETTEAVVTADPSRISGADSTDEKSPGKEKNRSKRRQKKVSPTSASKTAPKSAATVESSEDETEVTSRLSFDDSVTENLPQTSSVEEICDESLNEIEKTVTSKPSRSKSPDGVISDNEDLDIPDKATEIKQKSTGGKVVEASNLLSSDHSDDLDDLSDVNGDLLLDINESHHQNAESTSVHQKKERKPNKDTKTKADGNENDSVQEVADSGDAAGSDVENEMAMNNLKNALMSSDSDSDHVLPPRRVLRRQAKLSPSKRVKSKENKTERKLTQQEKQLRQLNPAQQRYIRRRTAGLLVSLREQKETALQKLVKEIEEKSVAEMDSLNKLQMRPEVKVERIDAENEEAVRRLVDLHMQSAKNTMSVSELIAKNKTAADQRRQDAGESEGDSDVEKEIKRLSKLNILLNRNKSAIQRSKPKKKEVKTRRKIRKIVHDSLSEASSEHNSEAEENSSSDMEDNSADIILIPDKEQLDNEEAMKNLLQTLTDSDSDAKASTSSGSSSDSDSSVVKDKKSNNNRYNRKKKKVHSLELVGLDGEEKSKRGRKTRVSSSSADDKAADQSDDDEFKSSGSEIIPSSRKRKIRSSSGSCSPDAIDKKLTARHKGKNKKVRRRVQVRASSSSSTGSSSSSNSGSSSDSDIKVTSPLKGRHKIRKVMDDSKLKNSTKSAHRLEMERRKRIEEKQKKYNEELLVQSESKSKPTKYNHLILEKDTKGRTVVEVDPNLVRKLKPHQVEAVQFLWDCVCETVKRVKDGQSGGCILAHCMGLGKTLSLITFVHTLLAHEDKLNLRRMLVIAPLNTVLNWKDEVIKWTEHLEIDIDVDELQANKKNVDRLHRLQRWYSTGGIMIIGYEMFRNLTQGKHVKKAAHREKFAEYLLKPGPDLVVCDEGHLLKNSKSNIRKSVMRIESKRRVVLTGTPLQNNLKEYHCMVDFVKPNLLGTESEFNNRFIAPITNGQYEDSTPFDVKLMKKRAHVLHEMLAGCVQRKDYSALIKFLPPKYEYILGVKLGELQVKLYQRYLDMLKGDKLGVSGKLFQDFQILGRVWTHPMMLELYRQRKSENSFIDDETSEATPSSSHNEDGSDILVRDSDDSQGSWRPSKKKSGKDGKQNNLKKLKSQDAENKSGTSTPINGEDVTWWKEEVKDIKMNDISLGYKFVLLLEILKKCEEIGDKVLLFSQSILTLDLIEDFLEMIDKAVNSDKDEIMKTLYGSSKWRKGTNYFRIDGTVDAKQRARATAYFNRPQNHGAKLFLISTRAGGMGINLVGANRVIIFDASWNPSFDVQAIFRAYRFGQKKPVYVYRLLAKGTMEEKIYERQIAKLSLSERVVDERQIDRHFTANDLSELYTFRTDDEPSETPAVPKDLLLADLLNSHGSLIKKVMEHDSLLENKVEEELSEAERKAAWEEFQQEKDKVLRTPLPPPPNAAAAASDQPSVPGVYSAAALSRVFLSEREKEGMRAALQHRFPAMQGEDFTRLFEAQCKQVNYQRFQQHLMRVGDGRRVNFQQMQMVQEKVEYERQLQQQQQLQQQRYMQYLQQQQQRQHPN